MFGQLFHGLQVLHAVLLVLSAIGFFIFWVRTRFWLPRYVHVLAALGLAVGLWSVSSATADAPIRKQGTAAKLLVALLLPALVYVFFVFYGGQREAFRRRFESPAQCPHCQQPVPVLESEDGAPIQVSGEQRCLR